MGDSLGLNGNLTIDNADFPDWLTVAVTKSGYASPFLRGHTDDVGPESVWDIDITDFNLLVTNFEPPGRRAVANTRNKGIFDGDNDIDITDFNYLVVSFSPLGYAAQPSATLVLKLSTMSLVVWRILVGLCGAHFARRVR